MSITSSTAVFVKEELLHQRHIFRASDKAYIFIKTSDFIDLSLLPQLTHSHLQELLFTTTHVCACVTSPLSSPKHRHLLYRGFVYTMILLTHPIFYNQHSLDEQEQVVQHFSQVTLIHSSGALFSDAYINEISITKSLLVLSLKRFVCIWKVTSYRIFVTGRKFKR